MKFQLIEINWKICLPSTSYRNNNNNNYVLPVGKGGILMMIINVECEWRKRKSINMDKTTSPANSYTHFFYECVQFLSPRPQQRMICALKRRQKRIKTWLKQKFFYWKKKRFFCMILKSILLWKWQISLSLSLHTFHENFSLIHELSMCIVNLLNSEGFHYFDKRRRINWFFFVFYICVML